MQARVSRIRDKPTTFRDSPIISSLKQDIRAAGPLEDSLSPGKAARRAHVGEGETIEESGVLGDGSQGVAADFKAQSAAVPVVGALHAGVLQLVQGEVVAEVHAGAEAGLDRAPVDGGEPQLIEVDLCWRFGGCGSGRRGGGCCGCVPRKTAGGWSAGQGMQVRITKAEGEVVVFIGGKEVA